MKGKTVLLLMVLFALHFALGCLFLYPSQYWETHYLNIVHSVKIGENTYRTFSDVLEMHEASLSYVLFNIGYHKEWSYSSVLCETPKGTWGNATWVFWTNNTIG